MAFKTITFGTGCFWCSEAAFQLLKGVKIATPGYAGGTVPDPSYEQVTRGDTGHAEVVQVEYNPELITLSDLLDVFWTIHDPTTPNRQGNDVGPQYRSIILYSDEAELPVIQESVEAAQKLWEAPIVTQIEKLYRFYPAEVYHRDYFKKNPSQAYCQIIINPKLAKLRQKHVGLIA